MIMMDRLRDWTSSGRMVHGYPDMILSGVSIIDALCNERVPDYEDPWYLWSSQDHGLGCMVIRKKKLGGACSLETASY